MAVNDDDRRVQYTAGSAQTIFVYPFRIFEESDLNVFQNEILLTLNVDYTVTGVNVISGGTIILTVGATLNDEIVIQSNVPADQTVDFTVGGEFSPLQVTFVHDKLTVLIQQVQSLIEDRGVLYDANDTITAGDNSLPLMPAPIPGFIPIWSKNLSGNLIGTLLEENADSSTLRTELADDQSGTDGVRLIGYFNGTTGAANTAKLALDDVYAKIAAIPSPLESNPNLLPGGLFSSNPYQRGITFTAATNPKNDDGTYLVDRFILLSDGNDVLDIDKNPDFVRNTVVTPNKKFGYFSILENQTVIRLTSVATNVSIGIDIRSSVNHTFKIALLEWTGTADIPTKDPISVWGGAGVTPTLDVNWAFVGTPVSFAITSSFGINKVEGITVPATAKNIGVLVWIDDINAAAATTWDIFSVKLEEGDIWSGYSLPDAQQELARCQRFYEKSYNINVTAGTITNVGISTGRQDAGGQHEIYGQDKHFAVSKFQTPTLTWYSPVTGAINEIRDITTGVDENITGTDNSGMGTTGDPVIAGFSSANNIFHSHWTADAELGV